jgi:hypothetical protein
MRSCSPRRALTAPLIALAALTACDIPLEAPILRQTWVVPTDTVVVGVQEFLPAGLWVTDAEPPRLYAFIPDALIGTTLGAVCGAPECQSAAGVTAPVPGFTSPAGALSATLPLPDGVLALTLSGGTLRIAVTNGFSFDPLRPNGAATAPYGSLAITLTSGAITSSHTVQGSASLGMPSGATTVYSLPLPTGVYTDDFAVDAQLSVPAGDAAMLRSGDVLGIVAGLQQLAIDSATVAVAARYIDAVPSNFDVSDLDLSDNVVGGALLLGITNPFTATAELSLELAAPAQNGRPAVSIIKPLDVPVGTSTATVPLSGPELNALIGKSGAWVSLFGIVNGTGASNGVTAGPTSRITIRTQLSLSVDQGG